MPEFIAGLIGCTQEEAENYLSEVLNQNIVPIRDQFNSQRQAHNQEIYATGGSPENSDVWDGFQGRHLNGAKGKFVFGQLKNKVPSNHYSEQSILNHTIGIELAGTLKATLEGLLEA